MGEQAHVKAIKFMVTNDYIYLRGISIQLVHNKQKSVVVPISDLVEFTR